MIFFIWLFYVISPRHIFLLLCRSPLEWLSNRWSVKARTTGADWVITLSPGAYTGLELAFPSGTTTRKSYWAHPKPGGSASTWTSTQGFWPFTEWPTTRQIWSTSTSTSSLARYTLVSGSGLEPELLWQFASWTDVGRRNDGAWTCWSIFIMHYLKLK